MNVHPTPKRYGIVSKILNLVPAGHRAIVLVVGMLVALGYFALTGCASLATPQTAEQRLAYVDTQFTALVESASDLRDSGALDAGDVAELDPLIQQGDQLLDLAWAALEGGNTDTALDAVNRLQRLLPQIRQHLEQHNGSDQSDQGAGGGRGADDHRHAGDAGRPGRITAHPGRPGRGPGSDRIRARGDPRTAPLGPGTLERRRLIAEAGWKPRSSTS